MRVETDLRKSSRNLYIYIIYDAYSYHHVHIKMHNASSFREVMLK